MAAGSYSKAPNTSLITICAAGIRLLAGNCAEGQLSDNVSLPGPGIFSREDQVESRKSCWGLGWSLCCQALERAARP